MVSENGKNENESSKMSFRITKDDRFFSRLLAKERSSLNSSSRIFYYGETSVAVPFTWEAQPGTPKHPLSETSLPPLTPPPSYFPSPNKSHIAANPRNPKSNNNIFSCILPKLVKSHHVSPSWSTSSSSSSCSLVYYSSSTEFNKDQGTNSLKRKCYRRIFGGCFSFGNTVSHAVD
uniref:Uncharacterized protein n=1 Tax=Cajanus cajan TaxID=3821 RepID=A0A151U910_CAJCA|nr:hypothetical protein KK1_020022 [Cajanus cajan]